MEEALLHAEVQPTKLQTAIDLGHTLLQFLLPYMATMVPSSLMNPVKRLEVEFQAPQGLSWEREEQGREGRGGGPKVKKVADRHAKVPLKIC